MLGSRTAVRLASPAVLRPCFRVFYSTKPFQVFDKRLKRVQRDRAASNVEQSREVDYLRDEIALRATERLAFVTKEFPRVLDLGSGPGNLERLICDPNTPDAELIRNRLGKITMVDSSEKMLNRDKDLEFNKVLNLERVVDEEENLSTERFPSNSYDAVISNMTMHWINDLPGVLKRVQDILVPDGMFMASMLGGDSLFELRTSLQLAEMERKGGISPRVSPLADVRDMGALLQQAKFNLLTVDVDDIVVSYPDVFALMEDIQAMGESNATIVRAHSLPRDVLMATDSIYRSMHGEEDGSLPATFRIIYMIGWKPAPTQPKPLKRGSGQVNLKEALPQYADGEEPK
uniref:ARAD1C41074p n=1 Tax=Blastobotrys adeninivorans TaxID=409370 RepID=A0A060T4J6_BLAAD